MKFKDAEHKNAFMEFVKKSNMYPGDTERASLFYILSMFKDTRNHINDLYDFKERCINLEGLHQGWQTGGTTRATKLAFNLFNGWRGEDRSEDYSPLELFSVSDEYREYMLYAVELRFSRQEIRMRIVDSEILDLISEDKYLIYLYQNDAIFRKSIDYATNNGMSIQEALAFAIINGYKAKNEIKDDYIKSITFSEKLEGTFRPHYMVGTIIDYSKWDAKEHFVKIVCGEKIHVLHLDKFPEKARMNLDVEFNPEDGTFKSLNE